MRQVEVAVIGTGWCGGIRAETLARSALVDKLHICEIRPARLAEVKAMVRPAAATLDYQDIVENPDIAVVYICTTPEQTHFPVARDCLQAGKHVLLEKPIALELWEADELITLAHRGGLVSRRQAFQRHDKRGGNLDLADADAGRAVTSEHVGLFLEHDHGVADVMADPNVPTERLLIVPGQ